MKKLIYLWVILLSMQSCNVYDTPTSVDLAVAADKKAKVITTGRQKYKFTRLETKEDRLIGITKQGSSTARKLAGLPFEYTGNNVAIDLSTVDIEKIRLRNNTGSTVLTVVAIAGVIYLAFTTVAIFMLSSWGM